MIEKSFLFKHLLLMIFSLLLLSACGSPPRAPVIERMPAPATPPVVKKPAPVPKEPDWRPKTYVVKKGDTLYSIALDHGLDYKEVAEWNGIDSSYTIKIGQVLRLTSEGTGATAPLKTPTIGEARPLPMPGLESQIKTEPKALKVPYSDQALAKLEKPIAPPLPVKPEVAKPDGAKTEPPKAAAETPRTEPDDDGVDWGWPASGKIVGNFNDNGNTRGIDIAGAMNQPVLASASGKVVHTGSTLRGYGKLIIIKHNKSFFSVYAHNDQILVKEGQNVVKGQKIAEMGNSDADRVKLHFEIRHLGKPVDPMKYLPSEKAS